MSRGEMAPDLGAHRRPLAAVGREGGSRGQGRDCIGPGE